MDRSFDNAKRAAVARLARDRAAGRADPLAGHVVDALNARAAWATTSSCSGRVQLLALPRPGAKAASVVLGRWHAPPVLDDLEACLARAPPARAVDLFVQPPILHVLARSVHDAGALVRLGHAAGFKASHVRSLAASGRVTVEVGSTERIEGPVRGVSGAPARDFLALAAAAAPALLASGHGRLGALARALEGTPDGVPRFHGLRKQAN